MVAKPRRDGERDAPVTTEASGLLRTHSDGKIATMKTKSMTAAKIHDRQPQPMGACGRWLLSQKA